MSENSFSFSKVRLQSLKPPAKGRYYVFDDKQPGLCLFVWSSGAKVFYLYRRCGRRVIQRKLGTINELTLDAARKEVARQVAELATGQPLPRRVDRSGETFGHAFRDWMETYSKPKKRTSVEDQRKFDKHLSSWADKPLREITRADVAGLHNATKDENGLYEANRLLSLVKSVLTHAAESDDFRYIGPSPARKVSKFPEQERARFLGAEQEQKRFFLALANAPQPYRDLFMLCLLTGQRVGNIKAMRWQDIDFQSSLWRIPRAKNGRPHDVPLIEPAIKLLLTRDASGEFVFPADSHTGHVLEYRKPWAAILKAADVEDLRVHDLRRTLGSMMAIAGASLHQIGGVLGHRDSRSTSVYARFTDDSKRQAMVAGVGLLELSGEGSHDGEN